jgi:hypothetical protein
MNIEIMLLVWLFLIGTTLSARVAIRLAIAVTYGGKRIRREKGYRPNVDRLAVGQSKGKLR